MDVNKALELIQRKLYDWMREFIRMLPNLLLAALVIVVGFYLSKIISRFARKTFNRLSHGAVITNLFGSFVYIFCIGVTLFIALSILGLDKALTSMLAGAGIAGLAFAFAFQDIAANFMSGILITLRRPLRVGDVVKVKDYMGKVQTVNLRDTVVMTFQGQMVIIPNKEVLQNPIENFSLLGKRRMDLTVGVSYGENLQKVKDLTLEAVSSISGLSPGDSITFFYEEFADSSINFSIRIWVATPEQPDYLRVRSEAIQKIKKAYDEAGITIPFPIRTLDFGIKGGQTLSEIPLHFAEQNGKES
ncbi:MAG TPA: mechanosensitive ion channel family protein [Flavisolibacter sp.]|jgi:small-conductance mechanosensitive channel|nr:mechanosensitive ion channel family protein [Flavisolibacter sp.]